MVWIFFVEFAWFNSYCLICIIPSNEKTMGMSLNRAQLIGNITQDPEVRQIPGGQTVATFNIATNFSWNDQSGQKQTKTDFHTVVAWRKLAEICGQFLKKGSKIFVEGRIQNRSWEGEDGVKRYKTEIIADNMIMLDGKKFDSDSEGREHSGISDSKNNSDEFANSEASSNSDEVKIDDLPF